MLAFGDIDSEENINMKETSLSNVIFVENDSHSVHVFVSLCTLL